MNNQQRKTYSRQKGVRSKNTLWWKDPTYPNHGERTLHLC